MDLHQLPHLDKRAAKIHAAIREVAVFAMPTIEYTSNGGEETTIRLLRQRFRKPFMAKYNKWASHILLNRFEAYAFLSQYIELRIGEQHWTTWGMLIHPLEQLNPDTARVLLANIGPCYLRINLGNFTVPFRKLLENIKPGGDGGEQVRNHRVA